MHIKPTLILRWSGYWYFHSDTAPSPDAVMTTSLFCGSGCAPHTVLPLPELLFTRCTMPAKPCSSRQPGVTVLY